MSQGTTHPISTTPSPFCVYSSLHSDCFHFSTGFTSEPIGARPCCGCGPSFPRICWPINVHSQKSPVPLGSCGHCIGTAFWRLHWYGDLVLPPAGAISFMQSRRVEESPLISSSLYHRPPSFFFLPPSSPPFTPSLPRAHSLHLNFIYCVVVAHYTPL